MNLGIFNFTAFLSLFIAYIFLLKGIFTAKSYIYLGMQLVGGISFVIVGVYTKAWSVWAFNSIWIITTLWALVSVIREKKKKSLLNKL